MVKLSEIIYHLRSLYERRPTDEADLTDDEWAFVIHGWRAKVLRQQLSDGVQLTSQHEQTIALVTKRVQKGEFGYVPSCRAYKTVRFPQLLQTRYGEHVCRFAERPLDPTFKRCTLDNLRYFLGGSRLTRHTPKAVLQDGRAYIFASEAMEEVYLTGIFENPSAVMDFLGLLNPFAPYDYDYPLSETLLDTLYRGIIDTDFRILKTTILDVNNDGHSPTLTNNG